MPVRDVIVAISLLTATLLVAFIGDALGSEYYLFLGEGRRFRRGLQEPPTSPWHVAFLVIIPMGLFVLSRRYAAIILSILPILAMLGLPAGTLFFEWTPGIAHYLLILCLGGTAVFIWSRDHLHED